MTYTIPQSPTTPSRASAVDLPCHGPTCSLSGNGGVIRASTLLYPMQGVTVAITAPTWLSWVSVSITYHQAREARPGPILTQVRCGQ